MDENLPQPPAAPPPPVLPPPAFPPPSPIEAPAPSNKRRANAVIIGSAAAVIAAIVTTGLVVVGATTGSTPNDDKPSTTAAPSSAGEDLAAPFAEADPEPDPEPTYAQVDADSFSIDLRTTERQCFGSAGCNVTVEPDLTYLGSSGDLDPDAVYEITYEIHGDESGPVIQTAELTNQTSLSYRPSLISTASASTELSVEITDITSA
ncbi:hypothetical protein [Streptomyces griseorubiginosus]|uniref:hypothetical protein n=1 Tax=Streptomyces griseorubiginosus TaxID=67304 RepID=UPI002E816A79|nr:hypothetical protein [Streptomyces griseorubiginosus]WUB47526.1 hypothetical protein OHN19_31000 [Streptomyces griseorubiginosus]WUB56051.1 hypothetical protein OG942_31010 [Streptomyces griseorubiginosus]